MCDVIDCSSNRHVLGAGVQRVPGQGEASGRGEGQAHCHAGAGAAHGAFLAVGERKEMPLVNTVKGLRSIREYMHKGRGNVDALQ